MTHPGPEPPAAACTLDAGSLADRIDEWRALVASSVVSMEAGDTALRLLLDNGDAALVSAASLGQREKGCCGFFDVAIELDAEHRVLRLSVPPGEEEALAGFVALLTP